MYKLTIWSCAPYEPSLSNLPVVEDMSQVHTSKDPDPLPTAKCILFADWMGTISETTETGTKSTVITYFIVEMKTRKQLILLINRTNEILIRQNADLL